MPIHHLSCPQEKKRVIRVSNKNKSREGDREEKENERRVSGFHRNRLDSDQLDLELRVSDTDSEKEGTCVNPDIFFIGVGGLVQGLFLGTSLCEFWLPRVITLKLKMHTEPTFWITFSCTVTTTQCRNNDTQTMTGNVKWKWNPVLAFHSVSLNGSQ